MKQIKLPKLKRPQMKGPQIKGPQIKAPAFVEDVYRDMRDRRLLIPALALLVALIAVPVLLAKSQPLAVAPPPAASPTDEATAAEPAVLAEQAGVRDYRERLEALKSKNPFKQQFPAVDPAAAAEADASTAATDAPAATADASDTSSIPSPDAGTVSNPSTGATGAPDNGSGPTTKPKLITRVVDVTLGPLGEAKQYDNVEYTDLLPSKENPIVAYFGATPNGKRAAFLLSAAVISSDGDGSCSPAQDMCSFLTLKEGEQRYLHFQPEGEEEPVVYRFKLKRIEDKVVKGYHPEG